MIFLGGVFSHAVRRSPASEDYRANSNFGVKISSVEPTAAFLNVARDVLARLAFNPVYARIDLIGAKDKILINEVELIEPSLYFSYGKNSTEKFVKVILDKFSYFGFPKLALIKPKTTGFGFVRRLVNSG